MTTRAGELRIVPIAALFLAIFSVGAAHAATSSGLSLIEAAKAGDRARVAALLNQKADPNAAEPDGTTALHWAVRDNDLELAAQLIRAGANVETANRYGVTPLYLAADNGGTAMIGKLLDAGANPNAAVKFYETALMTAARTGVVEAAEALLAHGAEVDAREEWHGQTALMWAAAQQHPDMMRALIEHGADVNARTYVREWERQVTDEPRQKWLPLGGFTPLLFATREGCLECARILIEAGAGVNVQDPLGVTPMISAIINGHYDVAGYLLGAGADPNLADNTGRAPLFSAVDFNTMPESNRPAPKVLENKLTSLALIEKLLARGANPNARLLTMQPYRTKLDRGDDGMLTTGTTPLIRAAKAGDVPAIKLLLAAKADPSLTTRAGITALMAAAGLGTTEPDTTGRRKTQAQAIESIQLLLAAGVDIDAVDGRGQTALHGAALWGLDHVVQFLAGQGALLDVADKRGRTPLDAALGKSGGVGFDGASVIVRESTADLLRKLMEAPGAKLSAKAESATAPAQAR